jgi:hypothetical protein
MDRNPFSDSAIFGVGQTIMKVVSDTIMEEGFAHPTYWYWYQLETSAPSSILQTLLESVLKEPMKDDTEGVSTLICISTKFDSVHFMHAKDGSGMCTRVMFR